MWSVAPTYDMYGNMLVGLTTQERTTIQRMESKANAKASLAPTNVARMSHKAIKTFVRGGIPAAWRPQLWMELSGAAALKASFPSTYFSSLTSGYLSPRMIHDTEACISKWMPGQKLLTSRATLQTVARVVQAYCKHTDRKSEESLHVLAAFLVSVNGSEGGEHCFWLLTAFLQKVAGEEEIGHCGHLMSHVLGALAVNRLPKLCAHLDLISFSLSKETSHWFSNAFVGVLPALTVLRTWDVAMYEGPKVFYRVALALLKRLDMQSLSWASIMSWRISRTFDADLLMKAACKGLGSFPTAEIQEAQSICDAQSRLLLADHSRRLQALLCPAQRKLQTTL